MKFYILCDIEGVASLACWDEARSANACYAPMAREMALEAAAAARGLFSGGADEVVIEDMHGDGCNIDCALLPRDARLLRGITHDIVGLTGIFDESYDGVLMVGFHDAASAPGNPTSHTYDAYGCSHYPGASLISPTTVAFDADDYGDVLRFFYFVI